MVPGIRWVYLVYRNLTAAVEKTILEGRLEDVELRMELKDVQLEFAAIKADNTQIRALLDQSKITNAIGEGYVKTGIRLQ